MKNLPLFIGHQCFWWFKISYPDSSAVLLQGVSGMGMMYFWSEYEWSEDVWNSVYVDALRNCVYVYKVHGSIIFLFHVSYAGVMKGVRKHSSLFSEMGCVIFWNWFWFFYERLLEFISQIIWYWFFCGKLVMNSLFLDTKLFRLCFSSGTLVLWL